VCVCREGGREGKREREEMRELSVDWCNLQAVLGFRTLNIRTARSFGHYKLTSLNRLSDAKFGLSYIS
jgi:hypothetical protein